MFVIRNDLQLTVYRQFGSWRVQQRELCLLLLECASPSQYFLVRSGCCYIYMYRSLSFFSSLLGPLSIWNRFSFFFIRTHGAEAQDYRFTFFFVSPFFYIYMYVCPFCYFWRVISPLVRGLHRSLPCGQHGATLFSNIPRVLCMWFDIRALDGVQSMSIFDRQMARGALSVPNLNARIAFSATRFPKGSSS